MLNYRSVFAALALGCCASAGATTQTELAVWVEGLPEPGLGQAVDCSDKWVAEFKNLIDLNIAALNVKLCIESKKSFTAFKNYSEHNFSSSTAKINDFSEDIHSEHDINSYIVMLSDYRQYLIARSRNGKIIVLDTRKEYYDAAKASDHFFDSYIDLLLYNIRKIYKQYLSDLKNSGISYGIMQCSKIGNGVILQDIAPIPIKNCRILVQKTDVQILIQDMGDQFYLFKKSTDSTRPVAKAPF